MDGLRLFQQPTNILQNVDCIFVESSMQEMQIKSVRTPKIEIKSFGGVCFGQEVIGNL